MDPTVRNWHKAIIVDCRQILGRALKEPERRFIESRGGFVALEMIHDHVKSLAGKPEQLLRYLNSEPVKTKMNKSQKHWKKGRGKLGPLAPLIGNWKAEASSPMGPIGCTRRFTEILKGKYIQLTADWEIGNGVYQELAIIGVDSDGGVAFWSFTSDGKNSHGRMADVTDVHPEAVGFEAQMPAGLARLAYWPDGENGFHWAVESKTKKGWNRFTEHHYKPIPK